MRELRQGLSSEQARAQLKQFGPNSLPNRDAKGLLRTGFELISEPMILLLVACAAIYFVLGELAEGVFLSASVGIVLIISFTQQRKAERALDALRNLSSPRALVIRNGQEVRIPAQDVVPGDLLVLQEGDRVAADGRIIIATHLFIDESLLTGESVSVRKRVIDNRNGVVFSSTLVVKGYGLAEVTATGSATEVGKIGTAIRPPETEATHLQLEIRMLVRILAMVGLAFCATIAVLYALTRNDWPGGLLAGLSAAMSLLPEEFPVILTLFFALGAWRLSKSKVLTRNLSAIEDLGAITALCVDKTGTLTQNKMTVRELGNGDALADLSVLESQSLPEQFHPLLEYGVLASHQNPFDPMERAIHEALNARLAGTEHVHTNWKLIEEYPLSDELLAMSCVWESRTDKGFVVASKGAPEAIIDLCHLPASLTSAIKARAEHMASQGLRVLAVARSRFNSPTLPKSQHDFDFEYLGLIGLEDPLRDGVREAVAKCHSAGIRVIMITGDYPSTALKIAKEAGLDLGGGVLSGPELQALSDLALKERIKTVCVFARTLPDQKLRIVNALKENCEIVAMTGDGVNDSPSLKWADVGIAMGGRGTDVAREASDLVLLDDQFHSIVDGIERGRTIYSNIRHAMAYIFAVHVPIAGLSLLPVLMKWPLLLFPAHIAFLELIIDPACTLVFENRKGRASLMTEPPRRLDRPTFSLREILASSASGAIVLVTLMGAALVFKIQGYAFETIRATTFVGLILANLGLIALFSGKSGKPHVLIIGLVVGLGILIWSIPVLRNLFGLPAPELGILLWGAAEAGVSLILAKGWQRISGLFRQS